jgi:hypothetical protein
MLLGYLAGAGFADERMIGARQHARVFHFFHVE